MSAISQKSISGITSITSPAGTDDQISLHTSNTNEALKIDGAGNLHLNNHVNTTGVSTASNFKTGSSNLHSTGLTVGDSFVHSTGFNVGSNIKLGTTGIITATSFVGDGSDLTNLPAGLGTALSATASSPLNKMYYTNQVLGVPSSVTVDVPASASKAYTQYADIKVDGSADLIVAEGDDLIPDILGLADFGTFGGGASAGRIRVNSISNAANDGSPTVQKGLVVTGVTTSTSFSGSGANLTSLPAGQLTGTVADARISTLTASKLSGALPAISGANLTSLPAQATVNNNADNRVITGGSGVNLYAESGFTYDGTTVQIPDRINCNTNGTYLKENQLSFNPTGTAYLDHYRTGQDIQIRMSTSSSLDTTGPTFKSNGNLAFASGKGIDFGSSTHASGMSGEILTDYEEGSWTPVFATAASGGSTVSNPSNTQATYVKVGRIVYLHLGVHGLTKNWAGSSTQVFIRGIPYRSYFQHSGHPIRHGYWGASDDDMNVYAQIHQYQTYISLQKGGGAQGRYEALYWSDMHWEGYGNLTLEITYETDQGT